ncbi:MAG: hypothetical protein R3B72_05320 [Polyangiaceae bacterium]
MSNDQSSPDGPDGSMWRDLARMEAEVVDPDEDKTSHFNYEDIREQVMALDPQAGASLYRPGEEISPHTPRGIGPARLPTPPHAIPAATPTGRGIGPSRAGDPPRPHVAPQPYTASSPAPASRPNPLTALVDDFDDEATQVPQSHRGGPALAPYAPQPRPAPGPMPAPTSSASRSRPGASGRGPAIPPAPPTRPLGGLVSDFDDDDDQATVIAPHPLQAPYAAPPAARRSEPRPSGPGATAPRARPAPVIPADPSPPPPAFDPPAANPGTRPLAPTARLIETPPDMLPAPPTAAPAGPALASPAPAPPPGLASPGPLGSPGPATTPSTAPALDLAVEDAPSLEQMVRSQKQRDKLMWAGAGVVLVLGVVAAIVSLL